MLGVRHSALWRTWFVALAFIAIGARALVPPGYMPAANAEGQLVVTLCGGGQAILDLGAPKHDGDHQDGKLHAPCTYAAAPALAEAPRQTALAAPRARANQPPAFSPIVRVGAGLAAPPPPSRGPPLLS
ncbi:MAG: DUF2946 family protein [Pseudomonadota bacterium]